MFSSLMSPSGSKDSSSSSFGDMSTTSSLYFSSSDESINSASTNTSTETVKISTLDSPSSYWTLENRVKLAGLRLDAMKFPERPKLINCIPPWRGNPVVVPGRIPPPEEQRSSGLRKFLKANNAWETSSVSSVGSNATVVVNPFEYRVTEASVFHEFMRTAYCPRPYPRNHGPAKPETRIPIPMDLSYDTLLAHVAPPSSCK